MIISVGRQRKGDRGAFVDLVREGVDVHAACLFFASTAAARLCTQACAA